MENYIQAFTFDTVPSILTEWGAAKRLGDILSTWTEHRHLLIVTDSGLHKAGVLEDAKASLTAAGFTVSVFDDVVADPPAALVERCTEEAKSHHVDIVLGFGGGSSMDIAKIVAIQIVSSQPLSELYGIGKVKGHRAPLVLMPTTAGTGSEVTNISILSLDETTKMGIVASQLYADKVILDAELTIGLPPLHTAATGIDAMVHAIEAYTSRHKKNIISDALAKEALKLLSKNLVLACQDGKNRAAREGMLLGAMLAGQAFSNAPVAGVHALAYPLGGHFHIPHGLSNALMLSPVLRFNATAAAPLYAELALLLTGEATLHAQTDALAFVDYMEQLLDASGAPRRLKDVNIPEDSLPLLARDAMKQQRLLQNNPVDITEVDALTLYQAAY